MIAQEEDAYKKFLLKVEFQGNVNEVPFRTGKRYSMSDISGDLDESDAEPTLWDQNQNRTASMMDLSTIACARDDDNNNHNNNQFFTERKTLTSSISLDLTNKNKNNLLSKQASINEFANNNILLQAINASKAQHVKDDDARSSNEYQNNDAAFTDGVYDEYDDVFYEKKLKLPRNDSDATPTYSRLNSSDEFSSLDDYESDDEFVQNYKRLKYMYLKNKERMIQYTDKDDTKARTTSFISIYRKKKGETVEQPENKYLRFVWEHDGMIQVLIVLPMILMSLYIFLVEQGDLFHME